MNTRSLPASLSSLSASGVPGLPDAKPAAGYRPARFYVKRADGTASGPHSVARTRSLLGSWSDLVCAEGSDEWEQAAVHADEISGAAKQRDISRRTKGWWRLNLLFLLTGIVSGLCFALIGVAAAALGCLVCAVALFIKRAPLRGALASLFAIILGSGAPVLLLFLFR